MAGDPDQASAQLQDTYERLHESLSVCHELLADFRAMLVAGLDDEPLDGDQSAFDFGRIP